jgi:crotonobetainyl-CoA:carnitine CoA-transferase CaiB-like acyl-CoA transferase
LLNLPWNTTNDRNDKRVKIQVELKGNIEDKLKNKTRNEWLEVFRLNNLTCGPINTIEEAFHEPQVKERKMIWNVEGVPMIGNPLRFSETKIEESGHHLAPPTLGQHTLEVLKKELNLSEEELKDLESENII